MKRHPMDTVSLVFGLIFLGIAGWWLVARYMDIDIPNLGWITAVALIVLGLLGVVASLRPGDRSRTEEEAQARGDDALVGGATESGTTSTDFESSQGEEP